MPAGVRVDAIADLRAMVVGYPEDVLTRALEVSA